MFSFYKIVNISSVFGLLVLVFNPFHAIASSPKTLNIPINVFILSSDFAPLNAEISNEQFANVLGIVNAIWAQAEIQFYVKSVNQLKATNETVYQHYISQLDKYSKAEINTALRATCSPHSLESKAVNLCIIGQFYNQSGGAFFNLEQPLAMWPTKRNQSPYYNPVALAHEFGHFLGLPHNDLPPAHLMREKSLLGGARFFSKSPTITESEIIKARAFARSIQ
jgi:hypothetical protein